MNSNENKPSLFSKETLDSLEMMELYGGAEGTNVKCPCNNTVAGCGVDAKIYKCTNLTDGDCPPPNVGFNPNFMC